jgi:hypothetical protein
MKTRRVVLILLILSGVLLAEVRLHDSGGMSKQRRGTPSLSAPPPPIREFDNGPMKFVDPPMPAVPPAPTRVERDRPPR